MKVLTVGGAMIDTIAIVESERIERMIMRNADTSFLLLEEGRKTEAIEISTHCGGGAVNASVAMARLGCDVAAMIKLGQDSRAETILARLLAERVSTRWAVRDSREPTGASVLLSSHDRNAAIFTFRGANTLLEPGDLKSDAFGVDLIYVAGLSNESANCFPSIVAQAKAHGAMVAINPGVRQLSAHGRDFVDCIADVDVLAINRTEADALVPRMVSRVGEGGPHLPMAPGEQPPPLAVRGLAGGGFEIALQSMLSALVALGPKFVVLTDGRGGAFAATCDAIHYCPVVETETVGTAGAGDAFAATFAAAVARAKAPDVALRMAAINAASVVGFADTQSGLLSSAELNHRIEAMTDTELPVRTWRLTQDEPA